MFKSPIEPTQIAKKCEKQMHRSKLVGKGVQYAPTLYTVLVNVDDDRRLFGFYPTLAGELETYLVGSAGDSGLALECRPLVRFIADESLKSGKFDVIAEVVTSNIVAELREEEAEYYGLDSFPKQDPVRQSREQPQTQPRYANHYNEQQVGSPYVRHPDVNAYDNNYAGQAPYQQDAVSGGVYQGHQDNFAGAGMAVGAAAGAAAAGAAVGATVMAGGAVQQQPHAQQAEYGFQPGVLIDARTGRNFPIRLDSVIIGREATSDIVLEDASISRQHARITRDAMGNWSITDLNSTNGTKVNGRRINDSALRYGDQITFGTTVLIFQRG